MYHFGADFFSSARAFVLPSLITHDNYLPLAWSFTQRKKSCIICVWDHPHLTFFQDCPLMSVQEKDTLLFLRQFLAFYYRAYTVCPVYGTLRERGANFTQNSRGGLSVNWFFTSSKYQKTFIGHDSFKEILKLPGWIALENIFVKSGSFSQPVWFPVQLICGGDFCRGIYLQ